MKKTVVGIALLLTALAVVADAQTRPEIAPPANGADWSKLSSTEKLFWSIGYSQGYAEALNKIDVASGGQRQRLALAIVMDGAQPPACLCLDEPTRGMDRAAKGELADRLHALDAAVIVATHDPEFAVAVAERVVLLADGRVIADGPAREVLAGGWYFATETARVLGAQAAGRTPMK